MSPEGSGTLTGARPTQQRPTNRLRLTVIDRDPGFMQVLANRLDSLGWEHRSLSSAVTVEALVAMRLNALVLDLAVLGPTGWEYLERVCARFPGLAVIVCSGPSSVARVRPAPGSSSTAGWMAQLEDASRFASASSFRSCAG